MYYSLCDHSGTGTSAGLLFTLSAPDADLSPGISESGGDSYGALLAGVAYTDARNKNDSYKYTKGVSMGPGFGDWGGTHMLPAFEVSIGDFRSDG